MIIDEYRLDPSTHAQELWRLMHMPGECIECPARLVTAKFVRGANSKKVGFTKEYDEICKQIGFYPLKPNRKSLLRNSEKLSPPKWRGGGGTKFTTFLFHNRF